MITGRIGTTSAPSSADQDNPPKPSLFPPVASETLSGCRLCPGHPVLCAPTGAQSPLADSSVLPPAGCAPSPGSRARSSRFFAKVPKKSFISINPMSPTPTKRLAGDMPRAGSTAMVNLWRLNRARSDAVACSSAAMH